MAHAGSSQSFSPLHQGYKDLVDRVAASEVFSRATQLREIFLYLTDKAMSGEPTVKERDIAVDVLNRNSNFDGSMDNIVRVQVGHLRQKLELYFASEGKQEPTLIVIPKGAYLVRFEQRKASRAAAGILHTDIAAPTVPESPGPTRRRYGILIGSASLGLFLLLGVTLLLLQHKNSNPVQASSSAYAGNPFIQRIFKQSQPTYVVTTDANLQLIHSILHADVSLSEYLAPNYPSNLLKPGLDPAIAALIPSVATSRYTSFGDANVLLYSSDMAHQVGGEVVPRYARFMNVRDFDKGNYILIGSRVGIPWVSMFESKLNFFPETDPATGRIQIRNKAPRKGELEIYPVTGGWTSESTCYVSIGLVPNLAGTGHVLLFRGTGMEATEAAAIFLFQKNSSQIIRRFVPDKLDDQQPIELLLRVHSVQGTADNFEVVAARYGAQ
jgi:hypothetical protein